MGEKLFTSYENTNSSYIESQKKVLDQIQVKPLEDVIERSTNDLIKKNVDLTNFVGEKTIEIYNSLGLDKEIRLNKNKNGILTIIEAVPYCSKPTAVVKQYTIVDTKTNMAFNANILWKNKSYLKRDIIVLTGTHEEMLAGILFNKNGSSSIIFNKLTKKTNIYHELKNKLTSEQIELLETTSLFHEIGHKYQFDQSLKTNKKKELSIEELKIVFGEKERNATAFSLAVIRKLKLQGLDLTRGLTSEEVSRAMDFGLTTYEKLFNDIKGPKIAQIKTIK